MCGGPIEAFCAAQQQRGYGCATPSRPRRARSPSERAVQAAGRKSNVVRTMPCGRFNIRRCRYNNKVSRRQDGGLRLRPGVSAQAFSPDDSPSPPHPPPPACASRLCPDAGHRPWAGRVSDPLGDMLAGRNRRTGARRARANAASLNGRFVRCLQSRAIPSSVLSRFSCIV